MRRRKGERTKGKAIAVLVGAGVLVATSLAAAVGGNGEDRLYGGSDSNEMLGAGGDDRAAGNRGPDDVSGGPGDDSLYGGWGADRVFGGRGNDELHALAADGDVDLLQCGPGRDRAWMLRSERRITQVVGCEVVLPRRRAHQGAGPRGEHGRRHRGGRIGLATVHHPLTRR